MKCLLIAGKRFADFSCVLTLESISETYFKLENQPIRQFA